MEYCPNPAALKRMLENLKTLCALPGPSGHEAPVREAIQKLVSPYAEEIKLSPLGNLLVFKKGKKAASHKVMLDAHMDEVGFIVTFVDEKGYLHVDPLGGIDPRVVLGKRVRIGQKGLLGVFGCKPIHLQSPEERETVVPISSMQVDIGAKNREEALQYVSPGDTGVFDSEFRPFGSGFYKAKALDDRAGCALLIELIQSGELPYDAWFSFSVQEETGGAGARTAAFSLQPEYAVAVECTTAADVGGVAKENQVCRAGQGAVISFMDHGTIYPPHLVRMAMETAKENGIPAQLKEGVYGGNDCGAIHPTGEGVQCLTVSLPGRYIHSGASVLHQTDLCACREILLALVERLAGGQCCK